jgi:leucine dehydrogenase
MDFFTLMKENRQEQLAFYSDTSAGLRAILAIHSTALGPAIGGIRIFDYKSEEQAVFDLLRLSRAMTYKTAAAGLNFGGGAIVIFDQGRKKGEALFRSLGRFIESFKGRFIAGGDMGVTEESMEYINMETSYVTGLPKYFGGSGSHSDFCAHGTFLGILAAAKHRWNSDSLEGKRIIIQGYGRIGSRIASLLKQKGAELGITDPLMERQKEARKDGFQTIDHEQAYDEQCHIFSPCAVGAVINSKTVKRFKCEIIAGSANNQLLEEDHDSILKKKDILWVPDFIINAGGIIDVSEEYTGYKKERVKQKSELIYDRTLEILATAKKKDISTMEAAVDYASSRIDAIKNIRGSFHSSGRDLNSKGFKIG